MIAIINEKASEYAKMYVENFKIEQAERLLEIFGKREDIEHIKILVENKNALIETFENKNKELVDIIEKLITDEHIEQSMYNSWIEKAKELIATKTVSK
jgi:antitoxin component YwqK of YwqJK toxin-antitoxin module